MGTLNLQSNLPGTPENVAAVAGSKSIVVSWSSGTSPTITYNIYKHTADDSGASSLLVNVKGNSFTDADIISDTTYYYWVRAVDAFGTLSNFSAGVSCNSGVIDTDDIAANAITDITVYSSDSIVYSGFNRGEIERITEIDFVGTGNDIIIDDLTQYVWTGNASEYATYNVCYYRYRIQDLDAGSTAYTTDWKVHGSVAEVDHGVPWSNLSNLGAEDGNFATVTVPGTYANFLKLYNYDFSEIPSNANIKCVEIKIKLKVSSTAGGPYLGFYPIYAGSAGSAAATKFNDGWSVVSPTTTNTTYSRGDATHDHLGVWDVLLDGELIPKTPTAAQIKSSDFGVQINVYGMSASPTFSIDYVAIRVHYDTSQFVYDMANENTVFRRYTSSTPESRTYPCQNRIVLNSVASKNYRFSLDWIVFVSKDDSNDFIQQFTFGKSTSFLELKR